MGAGRLLKAAAGVAAAVATFSACAASLEPWTGGPTPALQARTLAGRTFDLAELKGRTVIVNFWATWCVPCVTEMPSLQRLGERLRIEVVTVNLQENAARIGPFLDRLNVTLPVVRDHDGSMREAWRVKVLPSTFIVAPDGRIAMIAVGEVDWDDAAIASSIARIR